LTCGLRSPQYCTLLSTCLYHSLNLIPTTLSGCRKRHHAAARLIKSSKLKLWHKLKSHAHDPLIGTKYRACVLKWKEYCLSQEFQTEERFIDSKNSGSFFRHVNKRVKQRSSVSVIITDSGDVLSDDKGKADAFNKYYASVGVADNDILPHITRVSERNVVLDSIDINETDICFAISKLKNNILLDCILMVFADPCCCGLNICSLIAGTKRW